MKTMVISALLIISILLSCSEDPQESLFNPDNLSNRPTPVINTFSPAGSSFAGVREIVISGQNFNATQPYNDYNQVNFGEGELLTPSEIISMTSTEIVIKSPLITGEEVPVRIASRGAPLFSDPGYYKMKPAAQSFGDVGDEGLVAGLAVDAQENLYASIKGKFTNGIKKITPDGMTTEISATSFLNSPGMVYGPSDLIYALVSSGRINKIITINALDGTQTDFVSLGLTKPRDIDFDANQNLWVVAQQQAAREYPCNVVKVTSAGVAEVMTTYDAFLQSVRVYSGAGGISHLYVVGYKDETEQKLWRNEILTDGTLGPAEVVIDIMTEPLLADIRIRSIALSADDMIYMGTDGRPDALFSYDMQTGETAVVYPDLIGATLVELVWGTGPYLYASRQISTLKTEILKIDLDKPGASYYGRD